MSFQVDSLVESPAKAKSTTVPAFRRRKGGNPPLVVLTAFSFRMAELIAPHCDAIIVGDSLAQVVYGLPTTLPVSLNMMIAHGAAVVRGAPSALVLVDMPFGSYEAGCDDAFSSAVRILKETGAAAVKMEGGERIAPTVRFLTERGVPVMGHVGLTPQDVHALGGYSARGRLEGEFARILADARAIDEAGAFSIVVEGVVEPLAIAITEAVACPVIGIGASRACDGQVLVTEDMLGLFDRTARFVKRYSDFGQRVEAAASAFARDVASGDFPTDEHVYRA